MAQRAADHALALYQAQQVQINALVAAAQAAAAVVPPPIDAHNAAMLDNSRRQLMMSQRAAAGAPEPFNGSIGLEALRWSERMETYFQLAGINVENDCLLVAGRALTGGAATWWLGERRRAAADPALINTWARFVAALRKRFEPVDIAIWARTQLHALTQKGNSNVATYTQRFQEIMGAIADMAEPDRVFAYINGLPQHLRSVLMNKTATLLTLQSNIEAAMRAEGARGLAGAAPSSEQNRSSWPPRSSNRAASASLHQMEQGEDEQGQEQPATPNMMSILMSMQASISALQAQQHKPAARSNGQRGKSSSSRQPHHTPGLSNEIAYARIAARLCIKCGSGTHMKRDCSAPADLTTMPSKAPGE
jgi:hypothetical protein